MIEVIEPNLLALITCQSKTYAAHSTARLPLANLDKDHFQFPARAVAGCLFDFLLPSGHFFPFPALSGTVDMLHHVDNFRGGAFGVPLSVYGAL